MNFRKVLKAFKARFANQKEALVRAFSMFSFMCSRTCRFFSNLSGIIKAVMEGVVLVVVAIMIDTYVIGSEAVINQSTAIGAAVAPILQAALLIAAIFGAIAIIYYAATNSFSAN